MHEVFRTATQADAAAIWDILQQAIHRRKLDGSNQWQDGYPNPEVVRHDIATETGYVLTRNGQVAAYCTVLVNDEPAYAAIEGTWLTNGDFVVIHRLAVSDAFLGQKLARRMLVSVEELARSKGIGSIKVDTNFDNAPMLHLFDRCGYTYCGEVYFRGSPRKAFEKVLAL